MILSVFVFAALFAVGLMDCSKYANMSGSSLRAQLKKDYYDGKHKKLGYTSAREHMYGIIDNDNGVVRCVYTGLEMPCKYGVLSTSCNSDLNCEHIIPQSFFNEAEPMKSDIHHLRPSWNDANSARSNYPFQEIPVDKVYRWYGPGKYVTSPPPSSQQGEWSRLKKSTSWQPRDEELGDIARAVAYFFTMYPDQLKNLNRVGDMAMFADWNNQCPPDDWDRKRNNLVEQYQGDRNPYIDCPDLFEQAWEDYI